MFGQLVKQTGILRRIGFSLFRQHKLLIEEYGGGMFAITEATCLVSSGAAARVIVPTNNANPTIYT